MAFYFMLSSTLHRSRLASGLDRGTLSLPRAPAASHGDHVGVAHLLEVVRRQRRSESAAAIEDYRRGFVRHSLLDVALDHTLAQVQSTASVTRGPFALFADIDQQSFFIL